jgi:hypothetical protein
MVCCVSSMWMTQFFAGPDEKQIAQEIIGLGVSKFEMQHKFQLRD